MAEEIYKIKKLNKKREVKKYAMGAKYSPLLGNNVL